MSETVQSEVVKSVSETGEFEKCQSQSKKDSSQSPVAESKPQSGNGTFHSPKNIINVNSGSPGVGRIGSRSGSQFLPGLHNATLPSKIAIIVGLCQVAVGGAMVLTGVLAIRYQSYLFHYGTGLWAGLLSAITGMLGAMCTKKGVPKPSWLCGGRKWQIHVFLLAIILSLSSVVLLAIFSTSGLLEDAKTVMAVEINNQNEYDSIFVTKNTSGILINTVLLLLSILQVLLCFSSLGIAVRVLFKTGRNGSLLSSKGSTGSELAIRDAGGEYHARKDHLIHWLGHQRPNIIPLGFGGSHPQKSMPKYPTFVAIQPVVYPSPRRIMTYAKPGIMPIPMQMQMQPQPTSYIIPSPQQYQFAPPTQLIPICAVHGTTPTPSVIIPHNKNRRTGTPVSSIASLSVPAEHQRRNQRRRNHFLNRITGNSGNASNSMKSFQTHSISSKAPSMISVKTESEKNNEVEVTEVDVSRTYTGLDRDIADDFINSMSRSNSRKVSSAVSVDVDEDFNSERESTRM